jgi:CotH kinase protein/Lamin Tail Domain/Secretion system C-terminal sorting domain
MRQFFPLLFLLYSFSKPSYSQSFTDSNLPIVIINTDGGVAIPDVSRVLGSMKIIYRGPGLRNYVSDQNTESYLNYNGRINIEIRGSSSTTSPKKQYGFSTINTDNVSNNNVSLLGLASENDWILNSMVFEPSMIRDYICYNLSRRIGEYATGTVYCEVIINRGYKGLYLLQEKIKADKNRVDVLKIGTDDNLFPDITGGYITKADKTTGGDPVAWTMSSYTGGSVSFIHDWPKPENVTYQQNLYIKSEFDKLSTTTHGNNISFINGYPSVIDVPSFINYMLINELSANADAYQYSTFYHKDRNGKLRAGPIWDQNLTFGNDLFFWGFDRSKINTWQFSNGDNEGPKFWRDLFNNPQFRCYLSKRWNELILPGNPLNFLSIDTLIDQAVDIISEALPRENAQWGTVPDFQSEIVKIKSFIQERTIWMTTNLGPCSACSDVETPPIVITKIMYNPNTTVDFPNSNDLEFIEIKNTGALIADLTGVYFNGTGFVYQFPANTQIAPNATIILASNTDVFKAKYGFAPQGQFTRHLSNSGQKLVLYDGFGNTIDNVIYSNLPPWPNADGNGYYLDLTDPMSNNEIPTNWTATGTSIVPLEYRQWLTVYPTVVKDNLTIEAKGKMTDMQLFDIQGRLIQKIRIDSENYILNMSTYSPGMYLIKVITPTGNFVRKIIKE